MNTIRLTFKAHACRHVKRTATHQKEKLKTHNFYFFCRGVTVRLTFIFFKYNHIFVLLASFLDMNCFCCLF